jgi:hypothetical protein
VEQLRTHTRRLNSLHPPEENGNRDMVQLYEKGYGKVRGASSSKKEWRVIVIPLADFSVS